MKKPSKPYNYFIFNIVLLERFCGMPENGSTTLTMKEKKILRKLQISESATLYKFAEAIVKAFGFDFDHCFGFYNSFERNITKATSSFELFVDVGEAPETDINKPVKTTQLTQLFKNIGDKMLFLFDYGDDWRFSVELTEIKAHYDAKIKPAVIETIGKAPEQYP